MYTKDLYLDLVSSICVDMIHGMRIVTYMIAVGEIATELTLHAPAAKAVRGGEPSAQMVQQREPLSAAALSL